jgi:hypothetical protein
MATAETGRTARTHKTRATWVSRKERDLWCLDFGGLEHDRAGLLAEIEAAQAVIQGQPDNSLLVAAVLPEAGLAPELVEFLNCYSSAAHNPIHKLAILGVSGWRRFWYARTGAVAWPSNARFFDDYELAKDWLIEEEF